MIILSTFLAAIAPVLPTVPSQVPNGPSSLGVAIDNAFNFALWGIGVAAVVMIIYSGFMYIISSGRPDRTKLALQSIIYTAVGFGIVVLARSIVEAILPVGYNLKIQGVVTFGITFFMWVVGVAATIMVIISGLLYVTSAGDPSRAKTAKDTLLYAVIGLGIAVLAGGIMTYISSIVH